MTSTSEYRLATDLLVDIPKKDQPLFISGFKSIGQTNQFSSLLSSIQRKLDAVEGEESQGMSQYSNVDWYPKQCHINGNKEMLRWVRQILLSIKGN